MHTNHLLANDCVSELQRVPKDWIAADVCVEITTRSIREEGGRNEKQTMGARYRVSTCGGRWQGCGPGPRCPNPSANVPESNGRREPAVDSVFRLHRLSRRGGPKLFPCE